MLKLFAEFVFNALAVIFIINTAIAIYGIFAKPNLVKKIIALTIFGDSVNSIAILIGYRLTRGFGQPVPPVITRVPPSPSFVKHMVSMSVDPLPQALVLTAIVISLAVTVFLASIVLSIYRVSKSIDARDVSIARAREIEKAGEGE